MNILFVCEKPSMKKYLENVIQNNSHLFKDKYYFDYVKPVRHLQDDCCIIRKANNKYYHFGSELNADCLNLNCLEIPKDTYLEMNGCTFCYQNSSCIPDMDLIVCACDPDYEGWLAFTKYLEVNRLKLETTKVLRCLSLTDTDILNSLLKLEEFKDIFYEMKDELEKNQFFINNKRRRVFLILRNESNLSEEDFSKYFNIPLETIKEWTKKNNCPDFIYDLIEYKMEKEKLFIKK